MRIVIVGESLFALYLAKRLNKKDNDLVFMISDKEKALEVSAESEVTVVNGDPVKIEDLDNLNLKTCDVFIVATEEDELNILSALYAKNEGVKKIFVKVKNPHLELMLKRMDLHPINPQEYAAEGVALHVLKPLVSDLVGIEKGEFNIIERDIKKHKNLIGKDLGSLKGLFFMVLAVYKDGRFRLLANSKIEESSTIIIIYERGKLKELEKALKKF